MAEQDKFIKELIKKAAERAIENETEQVMNKAVESEIMNETKEVERKVTENAKKLIQVCIRQAGEEDWETAAGIEAACFPAAEAAEPESVRDRIGIFQDCFFLAEVDGKVVGIINGCVTDEPILRDELYHNLSLHRPNGAYQTIFGLDVLTEYRQQGIAAKLMEHMIATARNKGRKGVILTCKDHLIPYYEKFGYVHQGRSQSSHGGAVWNDMLLTLNKACED